MHHANILFRSRFLMIHNTQFYFLRHSSEPLNNLLFYFPLFIALCDISNIWVWRWSWSNLGFNIVHLNKSDNGVRKICWIAQKKKQSNSQRKQSSSYWSLILLDLCLCESVFVYFFTFHKFILFFRIHGWILLRYILPFQWFFSSLHC